jgi:hypothetical protein
MEKQYYIFPSCSSLFIVILTHARKFLYNTWNFERPKGE